MLLQLDQAIQMQNAVIQATNQAIFQASSGQFPGYEPGHFQASLG
jgi:hypothetical protein